MHENLQEAHLNLKATNKRQWKKYSILKRKHRGLDQELNVTYEDLEKRKQGLAGNKRRKGKRYDQFDRANEVPVGVVVTGVFREYTFLARRM